MNLKHETARAAGPAGPTRRHLLAAAPAALLALGRPARAVAPGITAGEILVGQSISLQGGKNAYGSEVMQGVRAALEAANRGNGIHGRRVQLRTLDDGGDAAQAEAHARRLAGEGVFVLFGSLEGGPSTAVLKAAVDTATPFIGPMAGAPNLRRPHQPLVFPVRAEHRDEFRALLEHGRRIGLQRVALFHADTAVGREHLGNVEKLAQAGGLAFGGGIAFKPDVSDAQLAAGVAELQRRQVDLLINHGSAGVYARLVRAARAADARFATWAVNSGSTPMAADLGPLAHGMVFSQIVPSPHAGKTALVREYQARLDASSPGAARSYGSLEGYMTAKALVAALRAAGPAPTRESLLAALARFDLDLGGLSLRWRSGEHTGSGFVDLALVGRDGRFVQ